MAFSVRLSQITKNFGGVMALGGVDLEAHAGEVLALMGENGAGKSTLMNILSGTYAHGSYGGEISVDGVPARFHSPADAQSAGIAIIHQELSTFPHLSVAENMAVGRWPTRAGRVDWRKLEENARHWLAQVGADHLDPRARMGSLATGQQQLVEIAKALSLDSRLLILDEPTSSLTPKETAQLMELVRGLRARGKALVYISHKMEEVFALADRVAVLRDGKSVFHARMSETDEATLITHMVGRSLSRLFPERATPASTTAPPVLTVEQLLVQREGRPVGPVSFELRPGEILGFAGLLGAGRTELLQGIMRGTSAKHGVSGRITLKGAPFKPTGPRGAFRAGVGMVGEDRKRDSIFPQRSLDENASASRLGMGPLRHVLKGKAEALATKNTLEGLRTRHHSARQSVRELSGGNQQKVVFGRVLQTSPDVIILDEPTRGVDVGAKYEIYQLLFELAAQGKALLLASSDLPELMAMSDRILVLADGQVAGEVARGRFNQEDIMRMAVTARKGEA